MVEYASAIWDPHTRRNINKLEQVQHHSARYVTGNHNYTSSISAMLRDLEWPTLEQRRHLSRYAVQNLQPFGQHWFHILAYTETVQYQRSCISFPRFTCQQNFTQYKNQDKLRLDRGDYNQLREFLNINWEDFLKVSDNSVDNMWEKFKLIMFDGKKIHSHN